MPAGARIKGDTLKLETYEPVSNLLHGLQVVQRIINANNRLRKSSSHETVQIKIVNIMDFFRWVFAGTSLKREYSKNGRLQNYTTK